MKNKQTANATSVSLAALLRCENQGAYVTLAAQSEAKILEDERDARLAIAIAHLPNLMTVCNKTHLDLFAWRLACRCPGTAFC